MTFSRSNWLTPRRRHFRPSQPELTAELGTEEPFERELPMCLVAVIAVNMGLSAQTANPHLQHVYDKLRVRSRVGVTTAAMERGWPS